MWENTVERRRPLMTILRMCIACWVPKATNTHREYVIQLSHCNNGCTNAPQRYVYKYIACPLFIWQRISRNLEKFKTTSVLRGRYDDCGKCGWDAGGVTAGRTGQCCRQISQHKHFLYPKGTAGDRPQDMTSTCSTNSTLSLCNCWRSRINMGISVPVDAVLVFKLFPLST
jgi:hypothetical protein